jgi:hypothetical protein
MTTAEKKQKLVAHENLGKAIEEKTPERDWKAYNRELQHLQKDYVKDTKAIREDKEERDIHEQALEFTDKAFSVTGRSRTYSMPHNMPERAKREELYTKEELEILNSGHRLVRRYNKETGEFILVK